MQKFFYFTLFTWTAASSLKAAAENPLWQRLPLPGIAQGRTLRGVYFLDAQQGWIVGDRGLCLATRDGGKTWEPRDVASQATLRCVCFLDAQTGWIGSDGDPEAPDPRNMRSAHVLNSEPPLKASTVLRTRDGGKTWQKSWLPTNFAVAGMEMGGFQASMLQAVTSASEDHPDGDVFLSRDRGRTWEPWLRGFRALCAIRRVEDKRWVAVGSHVSLGFNPTPSSELYTARACRAVYSRHGGDPWSWKASKGSDVAKLASLGVVFQKDTLRVYGVWKGASADNAGVRGGDVVTKLGDVQVKSQEELDEALKKYKPGDKESLMVQRKDRAKTLTLELGAGYVGGSLRALAVWKQQAVLAVGDRGAILRSENAGAAWEAAPSSTTANLRSVAWCGPWAVAVGEKGAAVVGWDDGKSWKPAPTGRRDSLYGVAAVGDGVVAVGEKGVALHGRVPELAEQWKQSPVEPKRNAPGE